MALTYTQVKQGLDAAAAETGGKFVAFDASYYLANYAIVRDANGNIIDDSLSGFAGDPLQHYVEQGAAKGYMPNAWFDSGFYRATYSDANQLAAGDLLVHYAVHGVNEGRAPNASTVYFNGERYLADNPDVVPYVEENLDTMFGGSRTNGAIAHYLKFGAAEQRPAYDLGGNEINLEPSPPTSEIGGITAGDVTHVSLDTNGGDTLLTGSKVVIDGGDGTSVLRLTGDADLRIDMTNANNQVRGIDLNGDGVISANGVENNVSGAGIVTFKNFEVVDAYARNPLNEGDASNNYLGDIKYDGTGNGGDGVSTNGNIYLGGLGRDEVLAGIGNDFLVGGGVAGRDGAGLPSNNAFYGFWDSSIGYDVADFLSGGRNADFMYGEFASLDNVDGVVNIYDGGTTSDDASAGQNSYTEGYSSQDSDWILLEISDDEEFGEVVLNHWNDYPNDEGPTYYDHPSEWFGGMVDDLGMDGWIAVGDGKRLRGLLDDVENVDASGNLYGFLDGYNVELGGRRTDDRDVAGDVNYGIGSSGQLRIYGSDESNKLIGGYDNDFIAGGEGNDLIFGGNMQFFTETVSGGVTNPNLTGITNDGRDELIGGNGEDDILFETDGGIYEGGTSYDSDDDYTDTLWVTNYVFGTETAADMTTDGVVRIDLGNGKEVFDADNANSVGLNYKGYGGADKKSDTGTYTADQTNYASGVDRAQVQDFENVITTGLGSVDYKAAGGNSPELDFDNQQNFHRYEGDVDLRGTDGANILYASTGDDVLEGREGNDKLSGGDGNDDFYFSLDGAEGSGFSTSGDFCDDQKGRYFYNEVPYSGEGIDVIHRQQDLNGDNIWDTDSKGNVLYTQDFGLNSTSVVGESVLQVAVFRVGGNLPGEELGDVVNRVSEIRTGVKEDGATDFTAIVIDTEELKDAQTYQELEDAINAALAQTAFAGDLTAELQSDGITIYISDALGRELADDPSEVDAGVDVSQKANTQTENIFQYGEPEVTVSQDRIIYKAYEDRTDNEGVDDDSVLGSTISLGLDNYAEDLVVDFQADASGTTGTTTYLSEDQAWSIKFANLTTEDVVKITVNGVVFELQVGRDLSDDLIPSEDTKFNSLSGIQESFLQRMASFITGQLDDDTAAGGLDVRYTNSTLTIVPRDYDAEEVVFIRKPTVSIQNLSGGEPASASVSNNTQHELQLYQFDGRDNALNDANVLFWGQEEIQRSNLETAKTEGGTLTGLDAMVIDTGKDDIADVDFNKTVYSHGLDFVVHGDDQFFGADGNDTIYGLTGDDRVYGSRGTDMIDGGKDLYKVLEIGDDEATVETMNRYEASERDSEPGVKSVELLLQFEAGHVDEDNRPTEGYFRDTLIFQQRDFGDVGAGGATFTITMSDDLDRKNGGEGTVEVFEGAVKTGTTSFVEMENIRTVAGDGTWAGQGNDTLDVADLSDATEAYDTSKVKTNGGLSYYLTNDEDAGKIVINYTEEVYAKVDGVENVLFGDGDDYTLIDETEAGKDNLISGGLGDDEVEYDHDELCCDIRPTITLTVEAGTNTDTVMMTGGILGLDEPTDTLISIEHIDAWDLANAANLSDVLDVSNVDGAIVDFHGVDPVLTLGKPDWSGENVRTDESSNSALAFINGMSQFEIVAGSADGDTVIVADTMENWSCEDDDRIDDIEFDSILNYDQLNDDCERLTLGDIRAGNDDGNGEIPWAYNVETFQFNLAGGTDRVDYSHETGFVVAVVNFNDEDDDAGNPTHVLVKSGDSQGDVQWEWDHLGNGAYAADMLDAPADRVDLLRDVEEIVASQYDAVEGIGGVIDLTQSDRDISITYSYGDEVTDPSLDRVIRNVHLQDVATDTPIDEINFVEYHADETNAPNPNISQVSAFWTRIEGSDNDEMVELSDFESSVDHEFNLRGGDNEVNYNELTRSIILDVEEISLYDEDDCLNTGNILAYVAATDGEWDPLVDMPNILGVDTITSYNGSNGIAAGSLRIEASQDKEDTVAFNVDLTQFYFFQTNVDGSDELQVFFDEVGGPLAMTLTGFEFLADSDSDDVYTIDDLEATLAQYTFIDNPNDDRDTIAVFNDARGFDGIDGNTISLEELNDAFVFDFDVLDIQNVTKSKLILVGDTDAGAAGRDLMDDVVVGDLDQINDVQLFENIWITNASVEGYDTLILDVDAGELQDGSGDAIFTTDAWGINASLVDSMGVSLTAVDAFGLGVNLIGGTMDDQITGGGGDDVIAGNGGADTLDGALTSASLVVTIGGVGTTSGTSGGAGAITIASVTLTTSAAPATELEIGENADADQIGTAFAAVSLATWRTGFETAGLDAAEAGALESVTYDTDSNELVFSFNSTASTIIAGDLTGASTPTPSGDAVLNYSETETAWAATADTFVYNAASDSTQASMDEILNFNFGAVDDVINLWALTNAGGGELEGGPVTVTNFEYASLSALLDAADAGSQEVFVGRTATDAYVVVDANDSQDYSSSDMVIMLVGVSDLTGFVAGDNISFSPV